MDRRTGGRITCQYYDACGTRENCSRCEGYQRGAITIQAEEKAARARAKARGGETMTHCKDCRFWVPRIDSRHSGTCQAKAPHASAGDKDSGHGWHARWPTTRTDSQCGEGRPKQAKSTD